MDPILQLLIGAGMVAVCAFAWFTRVPGSWPKWKMWADPQPDEGEARHVTAMKLPCGVCGQRRLIEDLRPHDIHFRICRDGLCRRRPVREQHIA